MSQVKPADNLPEKPHLRKSVKLLHAKVLSWIDAHDADVILAKM